MIKKENLEKTSAWPFVEAKKMLRERKSIIEKKGKITLQTGYGPSGLTAYWYFWRGSENFNDG